MSKLLVTTSYVVSSYVSRLHQKDTAKHVLLGTQQFKPVEFASQINLNMDNAWGILRCIVDTCMKLKEGKYLIMKDPNKVRANVDPVFSRTAFIFRLSWHTITYLLLQ